ncbi:transposase tan1-aspergillus niger [Lasallia pustulata]|uniref:Transposase tan1-aspergillus niger n=1 Tax=Lasallia pustulata TaxID=136370 RepID=A0A1W5CSM1_9LECA|nr:transposase tan1-aspergillus niger [Lasallia pustulata]
MPPNHKGDQEARISQAIEAIHNNKSPSIRAAARAYDVPHSTLAKRLRGQPTYQQSRMANRKLLPTEEEALFQWVISMGERGFPPWISAVRKMADILLSARAGSPTNASPTVGENWVCKFINRHEQLQSKYTRKYDYQRALYKDPKAISDWFRLVENTRAKYGIPDEDVYNFDETGFQMGVIGTAKVVTGSQRAGKALVTQPGNREWVTAVEAINASGWALPPMIIFAGKMHQAAWYDALPPQWTIAVSENGWTTDKIGLVWLQTVFNKHTKARTVGQYRLLILDGHGSHATPEFDRFCLDNAIITLCMPPHSSHLLQPLDVGCFSPLKRVYGHQVEICMQLGRNHIDKLDFLEAFKPARAAALSSSNICSGFAAAGLVPHNSERVLSRLQFKLRTPTPPASETVIAARQTPKTPYTVAQLAREYTTIKGLLERRSKSPPSPTEQALKQVVKGCQMAMHNAALLASEIKDLRAMSACQKRKREAPRSYIASGGVLTAEEGQERVKRARIADEAVLDKVSARAFGRAPSRCKNSAIFLLTLAIIMVCNYIPKALRRVDFDDPNDHFAPLEHNKDTRIQQAYDYWLSTRDKEDPPSLHKVGESHNVAYSTLRDRKNGAISKKEANQAMQKLTP